MTKLPLIHKNEDAATCAACGGACCKTMPGILAPEDVLGGPTEDNIEAMLRSGEYAIDFYVNPRIFFVRPATTWARARGAMLDPSFGGQCVLLTPAGCSKPWSTRPRSCRGLIPNLTPQGQHCFSAEDADPDDIASSKKREASWWADYQHVLIAVLLRLGLDPNCPDSGREEAELLVQEQEPEFISQGVLKMLLLERVRDRVQGLKHLLGVKS